MREKPKSLGEPRNGPGRAFNGYKDYGTPSLAFWLIPPIFPNEIFGDLLYKLSSVTTVNRYITRNATGPDSLALKRLLLFLGMRQKNPLTMSPLKKKMYSFRGREMAQRIGAQALRAGCRSPGFNP